MNIPCHAESWNAGVETKADTKVFWLYTKLHCGLAAGPCHEYIYWQKQVDQHLFFMCGQTNKKPKFGAFNQDHKNQ